jgi:hypothetical protein
MGGGMLTSEESNPAEKCGCSCGCEIKKVGTRFTEMRKTMGVRHPIGAWLCKLGFHRYALSKADDLELTWRIETECIFCGQLCIGYTWKPGIIWTV